MGVRLRCIPGDDARALICAPNVMAASWSNALKARDDAQAQVERLQAAPDATRYQTIRRLAQAHSKSGGLTISPNSLKSAASFQFWCSPEELDKYLDELK